MYGVLKSVFVASALLLATLASPNTAEARSFCAPRDNIVKILDKKFSEKRQAIGLANQKGLVELYVSAGGTWSMVRTSVAGVSCVIASGHAWEQAPLATLLPGA